METTTNSTELTRADFDRLEAKLDDLNSKIDYIVDRQRWQADLIDEFGPIAREAMNELDPQVREFEPRVALTDDGDGLSFYRSMASDAPPLLARGGVVVVEVADNQAPAVIETMCTTGAFGQSGAWKDRVVGQDRVLMFAPRE